MNIKEYTTNFEPNKYSVRGASASIGVYACVAALAVTLPAILLVPAWRVHWQAAFVASLATGGIVAALSGAYYTARAASSRFRPLPADSHLTPHFPASLVPPSEPAVLQLTARRILEVHFLAGLDATRPECQQLFGILQADWNLVNACFKAAGIKGERRWLVDDHAQALRLWIDCVRIDADRSVWCRSHPESARWIKVNRVVRV
jgi:hypothetical protein